MTSFVVAVSQVATMHKNIWNLHVLILLRMDQRYASYEWQKTENQ